MENPKGQSTSFIPQRPTRGKVKKGGMRKIYVLSYVSYVFFFFTLITVAGIFFYEVTLERELENQKVILSEARDQFSQTEIQRIKDVDGRIDAARERLDKHLAVSNIFLAVETAVVDPVQFSKFSYNRVLDSAPVVTFSGFASDYDAILFQREVLESSSAIADATISDVTYSTDADNMQSEEVIPSSAVAFTLGGLLTETSIQYQPYIQNDNQARQVEVVENDTASTSEEGFAENGAQDQEVETVDQAEEGNEETL